MANSIICENGVSDALPAGEKSARLIHHLGIVLAVVEITPEVERILLTASDQSQTGLALIDRKTFRSFNYAVYGHGPVADDILLQPGFNGERPDEVMDGYLLGQGHRFFNTALMRFVSVDTLSPFLEGGINCYGYCGGDPVNCCDPSGKITLSSTGITPPVAAPRHNYHARIIARVISGPKGYHVNGRLRQVVQRSSNGLRETGDANFRRTTVKFAKARRVEPAELLPAQGVSNSPSALSFYRNASAGYAKAVGEGGAAFILEMYIKSANVALSNLRGDKALNLPNVVGRVRRTQP